LQNPAISLFVVSSSATAATAAREAADASGTSASIRIRDVDVAKETANMSKFQILQQVGTAMLAQANQLPQGVLKLLG
jgi:flagellin